MADGLKMEQVQAAMKAMMDKAMDTPNEPIAMCIVDAAGNLEAYAKMDNLRIFSRRHARGRATHWRTWALSPLPIPNGFTAGGGTSPTWANR